MILSLGIFAFEFAYLEYDDFVGIFLAQSRSSISFSPIGLLLVLVRMTRQPIRKGA